MPDLSTLDMTEEAIQAVVMGRSGTGKTWLAGTFPRINVLDFDGKLGVLRNPGFVKSYGLRSIKYETFSDTKRLKGMAVDHFAFDAACAYFDEWMKPAGKWRNLQTGEIEPTSVNDFDTWVIDSGTSLTEVARNKALIVLGGSGRSKTFASAKATGMAVMEQQDWGAERSLVEQFVRMVRSSGKNVLLLVHEAETTNKDGILISVKPLFTGQSKEIVQSMFKDVWGLKVQGVGTTLKRVLKTNYDGISSARSELGIGDIDNPDYDKIVSRIRELTTQANLAGHISPGETQPAKVAASK